MSGLEPLVALGLACNILQVVDTAKQTVTICRNILESGSVDPALNTRVQELTKICEELKSRQHVATGASCTAEQQELVALAQSTITRTAELKVAIDNLSSSSSKGKLLGALKGTIKTAWQKSKIEKFEKNMLDTQRILETRLLVHICSQNDALAIRQREDFSTLGDKLCTFISNYEQGKRDMESLLHEGFTSVETHVTAEATKTRHDLSTKIDDLAVTLRDCDLETRVTAEAAETRNKISTKIEDLKVIVKVKDNEDIRRLLASVRYPSMNERRNQISETHEGTFEWVFGPDHGEQALVFISWLQSPDQPLFWISGKPGAGKTTLMKFLLEDARTRECLNQAHPNTLLISHFIWSVGDPTQRSLKGLLCSLLHQLVTGIEDAPNLLLGVGKRSQLKMKEAPGDWSVKELKAAVITVLKHSETPVCILVDGLDEIDTGDGPFVLLDVITQIRHIPGVKILVSSRPEPAFMSRLKNVPFLRVQDLTRQGICRYCKDELASIVDKYSCAIEPRYIRFLAYRVSARSNGVFLWASLALKSLERGISNGDSKKYLYERLDGLPDDLNALYKNMWDRLNEDKKIYREEAAKYLNFAMLSLDIVDSLDRSPVVWEVRFYPYAIVQLLALETHMTDQIIEETDSVTEKGIKSIQDKFSAFLQAVTVRCAGILEINHLSPSKNGSNGPEKSNPFVTIGFMHRSAREFLCNTEYGQGILQHDRSTPQDRFRAFLKACMARDRLLTTSISSFRGDPLEDRHYTILCCDPKFELSVEGILDIMDYMENQNMFTSRESGGARSLALDKIGLLVLVNRPDAVISSLEKAEKSKGPVSATYLHYLLMLAIRGFWFSSCYSIDESKASRVTIITSLISSGRKVNINATWRLPAIGLKGPYLARLVTAEDYPNSPLFDIFLVDSFQRALSMGQPHLIKSIVQICDLLLGLKPTLETRTLLVLRASQWHTCCEWITVDPHFLKARRWGTKPKYTLLLEVDTRFLLRLLCARLALQVRDEDQMVLENLTLFRTVIGERPGWIEVAGVLAEGQANVNVGPGRKVVVPNKKDASGRGQDLQQPGCIKGLEDFRFFRHPGEGPLRKVWRMGLSGCPDPQHLIDSFEYGSREEELSVFYAQFIERGLIVTNREVNMETWPPPRYDSLESSSGEALEVTN